MSKHQLRKDKTCQNCGQEVTLRFCPACGQENTETRQSFGYLVRHFIEDLLHYDGSFWETIKKLLFKPGLLTQAYLQGKRQQYVPPVKLYIFISFAAFFLMHICPDFNTYDPENPDKVLTGSISEADYQARMDAYNTAIMQYDSIQNALPESQRDAPFIQRIQKNLIKSEVLDDNQINDQIGEQFEKITPKALLFLMPLFAFILWLCYPKNKFMYFDHGIFILHFLSATLIIITLNYIIDSLFPSNYIFKSELVSDMINVATLGWTGIYFIRAIQRVYKPVKIWGKWFKPLLLYSVQLILFLLFVGILFFYSLANV